MPVSVRGGAQVPLGDAGGSPAPGILTLIGGSGEEPHELTEKHVYVGRDTVKPPTE